MDHKDRIDDYITGNLTPEQVKIFEEAMALDAGLRKEVNFQRQLHGHFQDEGRQRLLSVIDEVINDQSTGNRQLGEKPPPKFPWLKWTGLTVILIVATWFIWWQSDVKPKPVLPKQEVGFPPPPVPKSIPEEVIPTESGELRAEVEPELEKNEGLLAEVDPRDFNVNPSMESLMTGMRGDEVDITLEAPLFNAKGLKSKKGKTKITFKGKVEGLMGQGINLQVFSNQDINQPIATYPIEILTNEEGSTSFDTTFRLELKPGLYYFSLMTSEDETEVIIGKFLIDKP